MHRGPERNMPPIPWDIQIIWIDPLLIRRPQEGHIGDNAVYNQLPERKLLHMLPVDRIVQPQVLQPDIIGPNHQRAAVYIEIVPVGIQRIHEGWDMRFFLVARMLPATVIFLAS